MHVIFINGFVNYWFMTRSFKCVRRRKVSCWGKTRWWLFKFVAHRREIFNCWNLFWTAKMSLVKQVDQAQISTVKRWWIWCLKRWVFKVAKWRKANASLKPHLPRYLFTVETWPLLSTCLTPNFCVLFYHRRQEYIKKLAFYDSERFCQIICAQYGWLNLQF